MKKILGSIIGIALALPLIAGATASPDACGQQFVREGGGDYSDARMSVNIHNSDTQIDVAGQTNYEVLEVFLSVEDDGHVGYWQYASGPITNFNPSGGDITAWKVRVRKTCAPAPVDVCPNIDGLQVTIPDGLVLTDNQCVTPVLPPLTCDAGFHVADNACVADTVTPPDTGTTTPESTSTPPVDNVVDNGNQGSLQPVANGGSQGGHRHCDVPGTPACSEWVKTLGSTPATGGSEESGTLQQLLDALKKLAGLLGGFMPHDYKG